LGDILNTGILWEVCRIIALIINMLKADEMENEMSWGLITAAV
jgi:hypothetical protein